MKAEELRMGNKIGFYKPLIIQERFARSFSGLNMMSELSKSLKQQTINFQPSLSAIDAMTKSMSWQSKFVIPQTTIDSITSINRKHELLFGNARVVAESFAKHQATFYHINNLQFAMSRISGQIAAIATQQRNWSLIEDFDEVTEQALEFSETLSEEITEEQQRQFQVLIALILAFVNKHQKKGINAFRALEVILVFYQILGFFTPMPKLATQEDIKQIIIKQDTVSHYIKLVNEQLRQVNEYRITNRNCLVKLKPKLKTITLCKLPTDFEVIIIQSHHKWVYVSYFDPKDNLPQTGWIMKKYLDKPKW